MANTKKETEVIKIKADDKKVIVTGILSQNMDKAGYKGKGGVKRNISIKMERPLSEDERKMLADLCKADRKDKYCPHAINEEKEFFTVKTVYDLPVQNGREVIDIDEVGLGSKVRLSCKLKDNAIYPIAMMVDDLVIYNPFDDFE